MPFDYGLRLDNRQRIANAGEKPIKANKNQAVDSAEGVSLRSGSPQNIYPLPQRQNFRLERCPRSAACDRNRSTTIQTMCLTRSLMPQQHRPILDQLLVRLSLRQGQPMKRETSADMRLLRARQHDCCTSRPEPSYFSANFMVATGQLPSWLPIEIRRPWSSSSQSLSTVPAFPLVRITALPTSSV